MNTDLTTLNPLHKAQRIVIKVGSALLVDDSIAEIHVPWLQSLCDDIAHLQKLGKDVVVVSSGSVAVGRKPLGLTGKSLRLEEKQAAAAAGQAQLIHAYQNGLSKHNIPVAQVLLTISDTESRRRFLNASHTLETLLKMGVVPIINENDTVATQELRYGDNDRMGARVAQMVAADALVLFSQDIDGLYTADPTSDPDAKHIPIVTELTDHIEGMAGQPQGHGTGGMITKLMAAHVCMSAGCHMAIANGLTPHPIQALLDGSRCTWFIPEDEPLTARQRWISGILLPSGTYVVDKGAAKALAAGKSSLLPIGVTKIEGTFDRGDVVVVQDAAGHELARGLSAYASDDAQQIIGHKTQDIEALLGYRGRSEIIHRNDLVLTRTHGD